ncbi:hypothetical protein [Streptomyces iconiensis]|uniref:Uncharacterized protein n=1 Tax=Streptomyces iconiensis TaxID=1384038 RepID=A0ABT6ZTP3_9ACTN|nr:hypothetical protein [Streptomyces iconiensis]MDJ1132437.1 hypothetical protein [Streptomyces iconiensis]
MTRPQYDADVVVVDDQLIADSQESQTASESQPECPVDEAGAE